MPLSPELEAAFRRMSAAVDETWQRARDEASAAPYREPSRPPIDTLSSSLAQPMAYQLELVLSNAKGIVQTPLDRDALAIIARVLDERGLLADGALERLLKDFEVTP